jgi:hypothetical protein
MLELVTQAASNSVFIFFFCNFIIVVILVGSKSSSSYGQEGEIPLSTFTDTPTTHKQGINSTQSLDDNQMPRNVNIGVNGSSNNKDENDDDDDDELRRRVEEFIEKVNKGWKAELLGL